ncbi:sugar kinase [Arthrobacter sp. ISL-85]|uniref:sugar kinase n=1 Tax=Arthrobacter sp. ISL-85 TaxID=2819115 RepID=UPI001BE8B1AB|nr:sugar kinase [Arthrobacter sp. ISL-85]MBT2566280.1 sugar kinase [Arthrobacter sp. ISL-85]
MSDVITMGETMALLRADTPGPLAHTRSLGIGVGGAESNFAIALSRLGVAVTWSGRVGNDSLGELILRELRAEGIKVHGIVDPQAPTGLMIKERRTSEQLKVWYYRSGSAGSCLQPHDVPEEQIREARLLHLTGITPALSASAAEAVDHAIVIAQDAGTMVSLDLNYRAALWSQEEAGELYRKLLPQVDFVFAGDEEAMIALGLDQTQPHQSLELAHQLAVLGPRHAIVKLGPLGAVAVADSDQLVQAAVPVNVVDTVGAGDAFVAGYIAEFLAGENLEQRMRTAVRTGAFACQVPGDWEGMPRRSELELLESKDPVTR